MTYSSSFSQIKFSEVFAITFYALAVYVSFGLHICSSNNLQNEINFVGSLSYFLILTYVSFAIIMP